jgi:hypothetical protein
LSLFDKEMKSRHGQWLKALKKSNRTERAKPKKQHPSASSDSYQKPPKRQQQDP